MRLDHYMKTEDNNIHMASILYSLLTIMVSLLIIMCLLGKTIQRDFKNVELINARR